MKRIRTLLIALLVSVATVVGAKEPSPESAPNRKSARVVTPAPTKPPFQPVDITKLPEGTGAFTSLGFSNGDRSHKL